jgi:membrane protease YdiL (CAAX protease family)
MATITGLVLGYICVKTSSIWPAMTYHLFHNGSLLAASWLTPGMLNEQPLLRYFFQQGAKSEQMLDFTWLSVGLGTAIALVIILWLKRLPYRVFEEERLQEAINREDRTVEYASST